MDDMNDFMRPPTPQQEKIKVTGLLDVTTVPPGSIQHFWVQLVNDGINMPIRVPVMVARGRTDGPVVGITAAIHGNELNGIAIVQQLFADLDPSQLVGTVVGVPGANIPALLREQRRFLDGRDLNRIMPGKPDGDLSQTYAHRFMVQIVAHFDYLMDVHTASSGRINSHYIRADLSLPVVREMAMLQNAQIVLNNIPANGTLRRAACERGIHAITLEVGDPNIFQPPMISAGLTGIKNLLSYLGMVSDSIQMPTGPPIICKRSYWMHTDEGGILTVCPELAQHIRKGETIALMHNTFGDLLKTYTAQNDGIVIGKSVSPINQTGGRILHLGILEDVAQESPQNNSHQAQQIAL